MRFIWQWVSIYVFQRSRKRSAGFSCCTPSSTGCAKQALEEVWKEDARNGHRLRRCHSIARGSETSYLISRSRPADAYCWAGGSRSVFKLILGHSFDGADTVRPAKRPEATP